MIGTVDLLLAQVADTAEAERLTTMAKAWKAYYGQYDKPLKVKSGKPDDNVLVNKAAVVIDKGVSFLFGQDLSFEVSRSGQEGEERTPDERASRFLEEFWKSNRKMTALQKIAISGGVCGTVFVRMRLEASRSHPRLIIWDPAEVTVAYDQEDVDRVREYRLTWLATDATGKPLNRRQRVLSSSLEEGTRWTIIDEVAYPGESRWQETSRLEWPFSFCPVFTCQNLPAPNSFWGVSDIEPHLLSLIGARNFNLSNWNRINKYHASPKTWGRGFNAKQLTTSVDGVIVLPGETSQLSNLEMSDPQGSTDALDRRIDEAIHEVSRVPAIATGKLESVGQLSARALAILYGPLVEKTESKRRTYGDMLFEINKAALEVGGLVSEGLDIVPIWPELLPGEPKEEAETYVLHEGLGVSKETILSKLGYDPEKEKELSASEAEEMAEQMAAQFEAGGSSGEDYPGQERAGRRGGREERGR